MPFILAAPWADPPPKQWRAPRHERGPRQKGVVLEVHEGGVVGGTDRVPQQRVVRPEELVGAAPRAGPRGPEAYPIGSLLGN